MTIMLRVILILVSVLTMVVILRGVRQSKMKIEDSVFWIGFTFLLILFSLFPKVVYWMSDLSGTQAPVNFIFLVVIFILMLRLFRMTVKLSALEAKMQELVQKLAIEEKKRRENER